MRKIPNSQEIRGMAQAIIDHHGRFGEDHLIIYCRHIPLRNGREHQELASIIHCGYDMAWNFLQIVNWCMRHACNEEMPEKLELLLGLDSSDEDNEIRTKLNLFDNMTEMVEWLKAIKVRYEARQADLHNWD
jgi:hypothetical protein